MTSGRMSVSDEFGGMWKEAVVAYFKVRFQYLYKREGVTGDTVRSIFTKY